MKRMSLLFATAVTAAALIAGAGVAAADPMNNYRVIVPASCDNGKEYTFVLNGEGIAGHVLGDTANVMPVQDTTTYTYMDPETGAVLGSETIVDQLGQFNKNEKNKNGLRRDLTTCTGSVTFEDPYSGLLVRSDFTAQVFVTPRGNK